MLAQLSEASEKITAEDAITPRATSSVRVVIAGLNPDAIGPIVVALGPADVLIVSDVSALWRHRTLLENFSPNFFIAGPTLLQPLQGSRERCMDVRPATRVLEKHGLKARQRELLFLLSKGLRNKELAEHLGVSVRVVKAELSQLFASLDVSNRTELIGAALDLGLLESGSSEPPETVILPIPIGRRPQPR